MSADSTFGAAKKRSFEIDLPRGTVRCSSGAAAFLGIGAMVGAGIFALLGTRPRAG